MVEPQAQENLWFAGFYDRHVDMVFRICRVHLGTVADSEEATQDVFLKVLASPSQFESYEHEKAWLIRVAINRCKDMLKSSWNQRVGLDSVAEPAASATDPAEVYDNVIDLVMALPEPQRTCVYLFYYEGYNAAEIAKLLEKPHSTVRNHLSDARKVLREKLGGGFDE